jgi:hypothetical protein
MNRPWTRLFCLVVTLLLAAIGGAIRGDELAPVASRYVEAYPVAASKKGLQVEDVEDALALGVKHAALNVNLSELVDVHGDAVDADQPSWEFEGRRYRFHAAALEGLDRRIAALSERGVLVHLIILAYASGDPLVNEVLLHPAYDAAAPNRLGAFNSVTEDGRAWLAATMEFLAERWSRPDRRYGRVVGYIIGNEVNSHWWWSNRGRATMEEFADDYLAAVRLTHAAIRGQSSWARVYISLEHHWNIRYAAGDERQAFPGKAFVDYFARRAREGGDFDWHVAYHPYPEDLFDAAFWEDVTAEPHEETPRITFMNLEVLTRYFQREELLFDGRPRRIILSEQGFHSSPDAEGESLQAAAYCMAYKQVERLAGIDAFILHRHVDHPHEGGLNLGLRVRDPATGGPGRVKPIYECFRLADTPQWREALAFALPIVGLSDWSQLEVPAAAAAR